MLLDKCIEYLKLRHEIATMAKPDASFNKKVKKVNNCWIELCAYSDRDDIDDIKDNLDIYIGFQDEIEYAEEWYQIYAKRLMKMMGLIENGRG